MIGGMADTSDGPDPHTRSLLDLVEEQRAMGEQADAVLRLGAMLMAAGTGGYRVIRAMKRAARALGFDGVDAVVSVNDITCTFHRAGRFRTVVVNHQNPAVDASRIEALENLSRSLGDGATAASLTRDLDRIEENVRHRWSVWMQALAAGLACAGFAVLNHYSAAECAVVAVSAALGQVVRHLCAGRHLNQLGTTAVAAVTACLVYLGVSQLLTAVGVIGSPDFTIGYIASVLFLVPGFPLFSALLDLSRFDLTAGLSRLVYATTVIFTATMSVAVVSLITGLQPLSPDPASPDPAWYIAAVVATAAGIGGFAVLFNSSRRMVLVAATIGVVGNLLRLVLVDAGMQPHLAAFLGALVIGLLGAVLTKVARLPRITVTVPASVIMVPGPLLYRTVYYVNSGDVDSALGTAATASLIILAIGAGLVVARMLTDRAWTFGRYIEFRRSGAA
jgi:uncharacterized membrane protein YjjP (DUF1212 family)